ncbi:hypothetical protein FA95DRAFT_1556724 [Auriscalpium vulgare]|uniref:Uncharacterized protein n=1 Tax=Auriscalpium vulgare TaxID=40419 RepID=A0ACB8RZS4_9AGAM|nr:hypothetical protein FA95DRAFT_1556724 [Auriscalpium vulgare]
MSSRRPGTVIKESWSPIAGDVIVSNWVSWAEILWLAFRFNPIYVMPVTEPQTSATTQSSSPISRTPGRRTGTGSAAVAPAHRSSTPRAQVLGFCRVSLLFILRHTGQGPLLSTKSGYTSLEEIRRGADRPLVIFPECTTSNGRALLRFADIFLEKSVPSKNYNVLVMCIRYDPPTSLAPTLTLSIPTKFNPLAHIFAVASGLKPLTASIRLLAPSEGPSAPTFLASEVISGDVGEDTLSAACAGLIAQLGKFKKVNFGWEDKVAFLDLYRQKSTR